MGLNIEVWYDVLALNYIFENVYVSAYTFSLVKIIFPSSTVAPAILHSAFQVVFQGACRNVPQN